LTGTALVTEALEEIVAMAAGDTLNATDGAKGLAVLNRLIDTANIGRGNVFTERIDTWTLTIGKQKYTIGVDPAEVLTPDLTPADRPIRLTRANLLLSSGGNTVRRKIRLLTKAEWARKTVQNISGIPIELYNDAAYPLSTYWIYMVPDQAYVIETYSWQELQPIATLATVFSFPPGYYEYFMYGTAIRLAAPFGKVPSAATVAAWQDARANVMALNAKSPRMSCDSDFSNDGGLYNWLSGGIED
jgi:hypothetical protein